MTIFGAQPASLAALYIFAVLIRVLVGLGSYSGENTPPVFGDYEAQRHWMEITLNLPIMDWYVDTESNLLSYWGLDYPPLSAYHSWLCSHILRFWEPESVALGSSRGYESDVSKRAMRFTVVLSDVLVFFPAVLCAASAIASLTSHKRAPAPPPTLRPPEDAFLKSFPLASRASSLDDSFERQLSASPRAFPASGSPNDKSNGDVELSSPARGPVTRRRRNAMLESERERERKHHRADAESLRESHPRTAAMPSVSLSALQSRGGERAHVEQRTAFWVVAAAALMQPALILIDHGHFQYNHMSLGLTAAAVAAILHGRHIVGSVLFVLALNHKQMAMYYAPAFFSHLLGRCLERRGGKHSLQPFLRVLALGVAVIATFAVVWAPFLRSPPVALQVLKRLVPLQRGLFEDYVANFWCATHPLIKWKRLFSQATLVRLCSAATALAFLPACVHQVVRPSRLGFLYCLLNSSLAFFLFSYQVHEKSILLPMLPLSLLAAHEPGAAALMLPVAAFSMFPLLEKDGVALQYATLVAAACVLLPSLPSILRPAPCGGEADVQDNADLQRAADAKSVKDACHSTTRSAGNTSDVHGGHCRFLCISSVLGIVLLHWLRAVVEPPAQTPYLHDLLMTAFSAAHFGGLAVYSTLKQWNLTAETVRDPA